MKRPSFQFYPFDWQGNSNLRRCSHEEKGIWIDVMCVLHDQDEYGICRWSLKEIAQAVGCSVPKLKALVSKGILKGADTNQICDALTYTPRSGRKNGPEVTLIPEQDGPLWYSSRMVVDEYKRVIRGESSSSPKDSPKPTIGEGIDEAPKDTPDPSPSRARASSTSTSTATPKDNSNELSRRKAPKRIELDYSSWPQQPSSQVLADWMAFRKSKRAPVNQTVIEQMGHELRLAVAHGYTVDQCLAVQQVAGWQGYKFDWHQNRENGNANGNQNSRPTRLSASDAAFQEYISGTSEPPVDHIDAEYAEVDAPAEPD